MEFGVNYVYIILDVIVLWFGIFKVICSLLLVLGFWGVVVFFGFIINGCIC